jgi:hypothetical protein
MTASEAICTCEAVAHPRVIDNPPGRGVIRYRVGDYATFRDALLRELPGERELLGWRPTATGDLALQLLEWWAYIADILTFYDEQIANGAYLATASLPGAVAQLARLIGYRPRPGIGATGVLAAVVSGAQAIELPVGFAVQSKPGPGEQPKTFEISAGPARALPSTAGGVVAVDLIGATPIHGRTSLVVRGTIASVAPGDVVVLAGSPTSGAHSQALTLAKVRAENDPRGRGCTRLSFTQPIALAGEATDHRLLRSESFQLPYPYAPAAAVFADELAVPVIGLRAAIAAPPRPVFAHEIASVPTIHLAALARSINAGDLVLLEAPGRGAASYTPAAVTGYAEQIWYANAPDPDAPDQPPTGAGAIAIAVPHTRLTLDTAPSHATARVWSGFRVLAEILDEPVGPTLTASSFALAPLAAIDPEAAIGQRVVLEGAAGTGAIGALATPPTADALQVATAAAATLTAPLRLFASGFDVTEGKTVARELLGDGDPTAAGQAFTLQRSPLTYLAGDDPEFPTSTLTVWIDGLRWTEVRSFYGQPPDAQVFVTRQDADQKTQVRFGDGVRGARLPRGTANVIASYRYGSGGPAPAAGSLVTIVTPVPGLAAVRNPVRVGGGADPTPATKIRQVAPRSVLTFGRAVSAGDYEAIAANAPSVARARAYYSWDATRQRAGVIVYVGDDDGARAAAQHAIDRARDPNLPATVRLATPIALAASFTLACAARFDPATVKPAVIDAFAEVVSPDRRRIGEPLYDSAIYAACLGVAGAVAVRGLVIRRLGSPGALPGIRHAPGEGGFFTAAAVDITVTTEVALDV